MLTCSETRGTSWVDGDEAMESVTSGRENAQYLEVWTPRPLDGEVLQI